MKRRIVCIFMCFLFIFSFSFSCIAADTGKSVSEMTDEEYQQLIEENAEKMGVSVEEYTEILQNTMFKYFKTYMTTITEEYKYEITMEQLYELVIKELMGIDQRKMELAFSSVFEGLDANSQYFNQDAYASFTQKLDENMHGVGIVVTNLDGKIIITGFPIDNSPAEAAGICIGDELISIDGRNVQGMDVNAVAPYIRGELGTEVTLEIMHNGEKHTLTLKRIEIRQNPVTYRYIDDEILYLELSTFNQGAAKEVEKVLKGADEKGIKKVILDLRNNTGGIGSEAYSIASMFLPKDMLIATLEYKDPAKNEVYKSTATFKNKKYDTVILVNGMSASASELLAAAFQDNEMGILIGTNTYGKGTGQKIFSLNALQSGYKLTVCEYRTPDGTLLPSTGLLPDIQVENSKVSLNKNRDILQMTMEREMHLGDNGDDVKACQFRLAMLGYYLGGQTGNFDSLTEYAVRAFQNDTGLSATGELDKATQGTLYVKSALLKATQDDQLYAAIRYFSE
ncbi:MAG: PDZ domain-containing protein [Ruminococcaceae bacterium]|nr:PDZ domain-containing protein [Oscillospiraceae bacterium]